MDGLVLRPAEDSFGSRSALLRTLIRRYPDFVMVAVVALLICFRAASAQVAAQTPVSQSNFDIVIKNGHILDGTGGPWYAADVGVKGDRIVAIGKLDGAQASKVIDATGRIVSPGFIDTLGQSEYPLLIDNRGISKLAQGITSEITGEGASIAPHNQKTITPLKPFLDQYKVTID